MEKPDGAGLFVNFTFVPRQFKVGVYYIIPQEYGSIKSNKAINDKT